MSPRRADLVLGAAVALFAGVALTLWIPNDIESGLIEKVRRRETMGDALFPTAVALALLLVALVHIGVAALARPKVRAAAEVLDARPTLGFLLRFALVLAASLSLMEFVGPALVALTGGEAGGYRELRDTVPYKYAGFASGGFVLVFALITLIEGRPSARGAVVALAAIIGLILLYDVPFEDLLLPPNGDQ